ncbi:MAG TPA: hypothetical protein VJM08_13880 [Anaerolineales bacterium]|nr:hypothetical protein [Anaerolineales bacterium]
MKVFLVHSGSLGCPSLLILEGKLLLPGFNEKDDCYGSDGHDQENFHAHRIARSPHSVLYSEFANTKQL